MNESAIKEAKEGTEHRRLRERLEGLAAGLEFERELTHLDEVFPDVLRTTLTRPVVAFVGDAKDARHQVLADSRDQIAGYMAAIKKRIQHGSLLFAVFAIATNTEPAATEWVNGLGDLAKEQTLAIKAGPALMRDDDRTFVAVVIVG